MENENNFNEENDEETVENEKASFEENLNSKLDSNIEATRAVFVRIGALENELANVNVSLNALNKTANTMKTLAIALILVFILTAVASTYYNSIKQQKKVLCISLESDIDKSDKSDIIQVKNALENGGTIRIENSNDGYSDAFGETYKDFGAKDGKGYLWTSGAVINYIASKGWTFVQATTFGDSVLYFTK